MTARRCGVRRIAGFSLVEVLVVLGLIALLIGILVPALAAARRHGQTIDCATRMRQLAIAMEVYADEHDGYYPPRNGGDAGVVFSTATLVGTSSDTIDLPPLEKARPGIWPVAVASNLRQIGVSVAHYEADEVGFLTSYVCPSDPDPTPAMSKTERYLPWYGSFVFNGFNDFKYPTRFSGWSPSDTSAMRRDEIKRSSSMALFGEKKSGPRFAKLHADIYGRDGYHPVAVLDQKRHQGGFSNVAFADASTRTFSPPGTLSPENLWAVRESNRFGFESGD